MIYRKTWNHALSPDRCLLPKRSTSKVWIFCVCVRNFLISAHKLTQRNDQNSTTNDTFSFSSLKCTWPSHNCVHEGGSWDFRKITRVRFVYTGWKLGICASENPSTPYTKRSQSNVNEFRARRVSLKQWKYWAWVHRREKIISTIILHI